MAQKTSAVNAICWYPKKARLVLDDALECGFFMVPKSIFFCPAQGNISFTKNMIRVYEGRAVRAVSGPSRGFISRVCAINWDDRSGDVSGALIGEPQNQIGDIGGLQPLRKIRPGHGFAVCGRV